MRKYTFFLFWFVIAAQASYTQVNSTSVAKTFSQYVNNGAATMGGTFTIFKSPESTEGSPYFLEHWAKGKIYLKNEVILSEPTYSLNFDKGKKVLIMRISESNVLDVDMKDIERFDLDDNAHISHFVYLPGNQPGYFIEVRKDSLFSLYKTVDTKFYKSDYVNKGLYETGYKYDRYVDESKYYIKPQNGNLVTIESTNKKDLKKLSDQIPAVKDFLAKKDTSGDPETLLIDLATFLNTAKKH